jgi:hypothetical protein
MFANRLPGTEVSGCKFVATISASDTLWRGLVQDFDCERSAEMRYLCMYCAMPLDGDESAADEVSHGLCPECYPRFVAGTGSPAQEFLDSLPFPVFVLNTEHLLVSANRYARAMTTMEFDETSPALGGEVFQCAHAVKPGGCGRTVHCKTCTIRNCVIETATTGKAMRHVEAYMDLGDVTGAMHMRFVVTTEKVGETVMLTVEDARPQDSK